MIEHYIFTGGAIIIVALIMLYMVLGVIIEKNRLVFGHEASAVVIVGAMISYLFYRLGIEEFNEKMSFDHHLFFYFCLPPIVFSSGFNMKRKVFF